MILNRYSFNDLVNVVEKHLSLIDYETDKYTLNVKQFAGFAGKEKQEIVVKYDDYELAIFDYFISNKINNDCSLTLQGRLTVGFFNESDWYKGKTKNIHVDEFFRCGNENPKLSLEDELNRVLPISNPEKIEIIKEKVEAEGIANFDVKFDTLHNRYVVIGDLSQMLNLSDSSPLKTDEKAEHLYLYKYMTLDTYFKMLMNQSFRMNSIVSMNDESESFYLSDDLYNTGNEKNEKYKKTVENSRILISSFTDQGDSSLMWRLYGDSGKGVCICFKVPKNKVAKIHYLNTKNAGYAKLKKCVENLKNYNINLYFKDIDNYTYYTKSDGFKYEDEYRIAYMCNEKDLSWTKYGNLLSLYRDFTFNGNRCELLEIQMDSLLIGAKLPNFDVNYPLLVDLTNRIFNVSNILISKENKLRE